MGILSKIRTIIIHAVRKENLCETCKFLTPKKGYCLPTRSYPKGCDKCSSYRRK